MPASEGLTRSARVNHLLISEALTGSSQFAGLSADAPARDLRNSYLIISAMACCAVGLAIAVLTTRAK